MNDGEESNGVGSKGEMLLPTPIAVRGEGQFAFTSMRRCAGLGASR